MPSAATLAARPADPADALAPLDPAAPPSRDAAVSLRGVTKRFPEQKRWAELLRHPFDRRFQTALDGVTFDVARGEFFGLLGPNGAGKTTLFRCLSTTVLPDEGAATVAGFDVVSEPHEVRKRLTPSLANERGLNWRLSARENLRMYTALHGIHGRAALRRIEELLQAVDLADTAEKLVGHFSSGMRGRLAIARALIGSPQILLLDEPTRSLDPLSARDFRAFLRAEVCEKQGVTVLLATHSSDEALELCDRVAILNRGRLITTGSSDALMRRFGDERYVVHTDAPSHAALSELHARGALAIVGAAEREDDSEWYRITVEARGGDPRAAELLAALVTGGMRIARFERVVLSLADLIERVVASGTGEVKS